MTNPFHILFLSSWYPNRNKPVHGIFNRYFALAAALYNKVTVLNIVAEEDEQASLKNEIEEEGNLCTITVYYKKVPAGLPVFSQLKRRKRVLRAADHGMDLVLTNRGRPDLMQLNVVMPMGVVALHIAKNYDMPFVVNENWSGYTKEDGNYQGFIQKYYTKRVIAQAKKIMPTSTYLRDAMLSHGLTGNYQVVPNPVNTALFRPSNETQNKDQGTRNVKRFIHISSLNDREKNVSGIIRAFHDAFVRSSVPDVTSSVPDVRSSVPDNYRDGTRSTLGVASHLSSSMELVIVGEGVDEPKYRQLVMQLGLTDKIKFTGRLLAGDLVQEINQSSALVMFSNYETFCLVNIEAFACGKPVITSAAGAIPGYMKPEVGTMVPVADEAALANAMRNFDPAKYDPDFIRRYAEENFSYKKVGADLDAIYREILSTSDAAS